MLPTIRGAPRHKQGISMASCEEAPRGASPYSGQPNAACTGGAGGLSKFQSLVAAVVQVAVYGGTLGATGLPVHARGEVPVLLPAHRDRGPLVHVIPPVAPPGATA
jgi:hypothetical protein